MKALSRLTALLLVFLHGGQAMEEMRFKGSALEPGAAGAASVRTGGAMQSPTLRGGQPAAGQNGGGAAGVAAPGGAGAAGAAGAAGGMGLGGAPLGVPMGTRVKDDPELLARMGGGMASGGIYVHPYIRPGPDIDRFSFHNISIEDYPFVVCRSKTQCDYHLKKPAYYKSESYSVYRANAVSDTPLGRFTMSETARDRLDIKLLNTPNPVGWGEFNRGFSNSQKLCCHDYITKYLAVISMNDAAGACEPGQDHEVCRSAGNIVEGPNDSMRNLIEQPQRIWDFFGVPGPNNLQSKRNRAIKLIMFQLMMAMTQLERKRAVSRRLGWSHIFYSHDQQPPRVRMSTMLVENMSFFKYMRNLLVKDRADQAPFMIPMRSDNPLVQRGHVLQAPELNERILSPYFLDKRMADLIVDKRLADKHKERNPYRKLGHVKEHASWDEEARDLEWRTPPKSFHAPDIWNLGVMLLQVGDGASIWFASEKKSRQRRLVGFRTQTSLLTSLCAVCVCVAGTAD